MKRVTYRNTRFCRQPLFHHHNQALIRGIPDGIKGGLILTKAALEDKDTFNPKEATAFFGVVEVRLRRFLKDNPGTGFRVYFNGRCMIVLERFEEYLRKHQELIRRKGEKTMAAKKHDNTGLAGERAERSCGLLVPARP